MPSRWLRCTTEWIWPVISDRVWKTGLLIVLAVPLALLLVDVAGELEQPGSRLGADPGAEIVHRLGAWSIRLLLLTLAVSTLRRLFNMPRLIRYRRLIGLLAFAYVLLHFLAYLSFLAGFDWHAIEEDLVARTYITVGFLALVCLVPLAVTSTDNWRRRLGRKWVKLHRLVYLIVSLGLLHYFWLIKDDYAEWVFYFALFLALMLERGYRRWQRS